MDSLHGLQCGSASFRYSTMVVLLMMFVTCSISIKEQKSPKNTATKNAIMQGRTPPSSVSSKLGSCRLVSPSGILVGFFATTARNSSAAPSCSQAVVAATTPAGLTLLDP